MLDPLERIFDDCRRVAQRIYFGRRYQGAPEVVIMLPSGRVTILRPDISQRLSNHSPTGFEWGFGGSGPAQLALAILHHCYGNVIALRSYQRFKGQVIARMPRDEWELTASEIYIWMQADMQNQPHVADAYFKAKWDGAR